MSLHRVVTGWVLQGWVVQRWLVPAAFILLTAGCGVRQAPVDSPVLPPTKLLDFKVLYSENCAGCHGVDGKGSAARALNDPVYLAIAGDAVIREVTEKGVANTAMPAFAEQSGGFLTEEQIGVIVEGMRGRWSKPDFLSKENPPPYHAQTPGDPNRGAAVYDTFCASCHGPGGRGGPHATSIVDASYLALVSDQSLRTTAIAGRPEMGAPDWRGDVPGKPMTAENVSDVVAWLVAQRPQIPPKLVGGNR